MLVFCTLWKRKRKRNRKETIKSNTRFLYSSTLLEAKYIDGAKENGHKYWYHHQAIQNTSVNMIPKS